MITINHGMSALVCAGVVLPLVKHHQPVSPRALSWAIFLGAMAPDADILSKLGGRAVYFSGAWYAHREASHSLLGTLLLGLVVAGLVMLVARLNGRQLGAWLWLAGAGWAGGMIHIFGDLFTPGMKMPVFWPGESTFGGLRHIGWFSPYLLWLFVTTLLLGWALTQIKRWRPQWQGGCNVATWMIFFAATWRWVGFLMNSRYESNVQWVEFHRSLLPDGMIDPLQEGVRQAWYWLTG